MSTDAVILGTGTTNTTPGSVVTVKASYDSDLLLFDPKNEAVVVIPKEKAKEFMQEANQMMVICQALSAAKENVLAFEEKLEAAEVERFPSQGDIIFWKAQLKKAQQAYDAAYGAVKEELKDKGYLATAGNGKEMLELIPLAQRKVGGKPQPWARKWTYVRSEKVQNHWRAYPFNKKEKGQPASFVKNGKIDTPALKEQFGKLEPKLKAEWTLAHDAGFLFPNLQAWAEGVNAKSDGEHISFEYGVQLFRYFAGCAAGAEWSPKGGKIAAKFNGKAELMIARGESRAEGYLPSKDGWAWALIGMKTGKEFHIGAMRFFGEIKVTAAAGASAAAELGLEVDYSELTKAGVKGARRAPGANANARKAMLDKVGVEAAAGADLFAGAKVGGELTGALQYKSPEVTNGKLDSFESMASVGPKVELQFGAGAAACLIVHYEKGKFRLKVKAGLCLGPGAKGEIGLEVDAKRIGKFMEWLFHALLNANFEMLQVVTTKCYEAAMQLQVMMLNGVEDAYKNVDDQWDKFKRHLELEDQRVVLMNRVLSNPPELRLCVPEAHGILLHQLTRHGTLTKFKPENTGFEFEVMGRRKQAVLQVCKWAQCKRQFENMVQHIGPQGAKGGFKGNYEGLLRFMEIGLLDSAYDDKLRALYLSLPDNPARGFPVALNDSTTFKTQVRMIESHTYLALLQGRKMPNGHMV